MLSEDIAVDRSDGSGTTLEFAVGIVLTFAVNLVFLYVAANCTSIALHTFQKIEDYRNKYGALNMYLRRNRVSKQLAKLVRSHFRASYENSATTLTDEQVRAQHLPQTPPGPLRCAAPVRLLIARVAARAPGRRSLLLLPLWLIVVDCG